jgi:hypothetical protein
MVLPITLAAAGAAALINVWLAIRTGRVRTREKVMVGDGGNDAVIRRMRAHANFVEYTPFVLILIGLIELATGTSTWLWIVMAVYMAGRIAHGFGMDGNMAARGAGTGITLLTLLGLGLYAVAIPYFAFGEPQAPTQIELQSAEEVPQG